MADPIISPDGKFMYTGTEWIPAPPSATETTSPDTVSLQDSVNSGNINIIHNDAEDIAEAMVSALNIAKGNEEGKKDCVEVQLFCVDKEWKYTPDADFYDSRKGWLTSPRISSMMQDIEHSKPSGDPVILQLFDADEVLRIEFVNDKGSYECNHYTGDPPVKESTTDWYESIQWMKDFVKANKQKVIPAPKGEFNLVGFVSDKSEGKGNLNNIQSIREKNESENGVNIENTTESSHNSNMKKCVVCSNSSEHSNNSCKVCGNSICKPCSTKQRMVWLPVAVIFFPMAWLLFAADVHCNSCKETKKQNDKNHNFLIVMLLVALILAGIKASMGP